MCVNVCMCLGVCVCSCVGICVVLFLLLSIPLFNCCMHLNKIVSYSDHLN